MIALMSVATKEYVCEKRGKNMSATNFTSFAFGKSCSSLISTSGGVYGRWSDQLLRSFIFNNFFRDILSGRYHMMHQALWDDLHYDCDEQDKEDACDRGRKVSVLGKVSVYNSHDH